MANLIEIFLNKLKIVEEELDETLYWLEIIIKAGLMKDSEVNDLKDENLQLFKIIASSIVTMKKKINH